MEKYWNSNSLAAYPTALAANWSGQEETVEPAELAVVIGSLTTRRAWERERKE